MEHHHSLEKGMQKSKDTNQSIRMSGSNSNNITTIVEELNHQIKNKESEKNTVI